jgi:Type IV secretory pathway, VirD4 components
MKNQNSTSFVPPYSKHFNLVPTTSTTKYPCTPLALFGDKAICANKENVITIGCAGSMKTNSVMMNSIMASRDAEECMIIADPQGELYKTTAKALEDSGYEVKLISLTSGADTTSKWNPLNDDIFWADKEVPDAAATIAHRLLTHFRASEATNDIDFALQKTLLTAALLHIHRCEEVSSLTGVCKFLQSTLEEMENAIHKTQGALHREVIEVFTSFIESAGNKADNARRELLKKLTFCYDECIAALIETSEVNLQNLLGYTTEPNPDYDPNAISVPGIDHKTIPPAILETYHKCAYFINSPWEFKKPESALGTLFLQMAMDNIAQTDMMGYPRLDRPVHFILDEFSQLWPNMSDFVQNVRRLNGKAHFTVSLQFFDKIPKSEILYKWHQAFETFVFTSAEMFNWHEEELDKILSEMDKDGVDIGMMLNKVISSSDDRSALIWSRGNCAVVGDKAYAPLMYPELLR